jgi:GT2 family glycosyltransferase
MPAPDVSLLMPVRNGVRYLAQAIASLGECREPRLELIIVDDGSTDATGEIIERGRRLDERIVALTQPASGIAAALERARRQARAPLLARLDSDDLAYPNRFQLQLERFLADPDLLLLGSAVDKIDEAGRIVGSIRYPGEPDELQQELRRRNVFVHSSVMMRHSAVQRVGGYRGFFLAAEDYDLWLRIAEQGKVANLPDRLGGHRVHAASTTARHVFRQAFSAALARTCAVARCRHSPDPANGLERPIDIEGEDWPRALDDEVRLYRGLAFADSAAFAKRRPTIDEVHRLLARGLPPVERKLAQAALAGILRHNAVPQPFSRLHIAAALLAMGAWRAARLLLRRDQPS